MKTCFKCGLQKPLSEFYRHKAMRDGYLGKCKDCAKKDTHDNYRLNFQAHHEDYSKPIDVMWLCFRHHRERHGQLKHLIQKP